MDDNFSQAKELWDKFLLITQEMQKFLGEDEIDTFLDLLDQRLRLQKMIEALPSNEYHLSQEGKKTIAQIHALNIDIQYKVRVWLNKTKKSQQMARAYDSLGYGVTGYQLNRVY